MTSLVEMTILSYSTLWENKENSMESLSGLCYLFIYNFYFQSFQKVLSCDFILFYLIFGSIFRIPHLVHLRITPILSIPLAVLFLVWAGDLWQPPINNKEMLAVIHCLEAWRYFLQESRSKFEVWTDYKNLMYFMSNQKLNSRQAR